MSFSRTLSSQPWDLVSSLHCTSPDTYTHTHARARALDLQHQTRLEPTRRGRRFRYCIRSPDVGVFLCRSTTEEPAVGLGVVNSRLSFSLSIRSATQTHTHTVSAGSGSYGRAEWRHFFLREKRKEKTPKTWAFQSKPVSPAAPPGAMCRHSSGSRSPETGHTPFCQWMDAAAMLGR